MAEARKVPNKFSSEILEIDLPSIKKARAPKRSKGPDISTIAGIDLAKIQEDRVSRNRVFELFGLTLKLILETHADNLVARSLIAVGHGKDRKIYSYPDHKTRQKAVEAAEKMVGLIRGDEDLAASQPVVINLLPDTRSKVEELIGEPLQLASGEIIGVQPQTPAVAETNGTEIADDTTLEGNRAFEQADRPGPQPGSQDDRESAEEAERSRAAYADSGTGDSDDGGDARTGDSGEAGGDESYDFSFD